MMKHVYEQKPIKIDEFNEAEEKEVKQRIEKQKIKRREIAPPPPSATPPPPPQKKSSAGKIKNNRKINKRKCKKH